MYRVTAPDGVSTTWATREIAALDFLLGIPLEAERSIVRAGLSGVDRRRKEHRENAGVAPLGPGDETNGDNLFSRHSGDSVRIGGTGEVVVVRRHRGGEREESERGGGGGGAAVAMEHVGVGRTSSVVPATATPTRWWEKLLRVEADPKAERAARRRLQETQELERPDEGGGGGGGGGGDDDDDEDDGQDEEVAANYSSAAGNADSAVARSPNSGARGSSRITPAAPRAPGRRLEGREDAVFIRIPRDVESMTSHRGLARQAAVREWEVRTAHGLDASSEGMIRRSSLEIDSGIVPIIEDEEMGGKRSPTNTGLLDGRAFFSSCGSYPVGVFSVIKYDPKSEEAARRRKKLEELGGGGTQFVMPARDWRGISYRALLPRIEKKNKSFNRFLRKNRRDIAAKIRRETKKLSRSRDRSLSKISKMDILAGDTSENTSRTHTDDEASDTSRIASDDEDGDASVSSSSSDESDSYVPGFLDDPEMVQGRHRHVMRGDQTTGPIVCSTIQFVQPSVLKADLNRQFKERFDGWEPPKAQRKYIGARIINGVYTPHDPTEDGGDSGADCADGIGFEVDGMLDLHRRMRSSSDVSASTVIRMPPSLTLSKIRSVKQQALVACVKANIEISTVALACIYFERLCLDCRVDKSNRRLSFAACLLLSAKINEANVAIVHDQDGKYRDGRNSSGEKEGNGKKKVGVLRSWIRPTKKSRNITEALFEFFTHDWSLSLKHLFAAEWVVFTALGFRVHATPYQVAFHFKRLMKVLEWNPMAYLGREMHGRWQDCLDDEAARKEHHEGRKTMRRKQKERKLLRLQRELHQQQAAEEAAQAAASAKRVSSTGSFSSHNHFESNRHRSGLIVSTRGVKAKLAPVVARTEKETGQLLQLPVVSNMRQTLSAGQLPLLARDTAAVAHKKEVLMRRNSEVHLAPKPSKWNRFALIKQPSASGGVLASRKSDRPRQSTQKSHLPGPSGKPIKRTRSSSSVDKMAVRMEKTGGTQSVVIDMSGAEEDICSENTSKHRDDITV